MLLVVAKTKEDAEKFRRCYAKMHCFVYCATHRNFINSVNEYQPTAVLIQMDKVSFTLKEKIKKVKMLFPSLPLIIMSDEKISLPEIEMTLPSRVSSRKLLFQALFYTPASATSSLLKDNLIVHGLLLAVHNRYAFLYGKRANFTAEEVFLLRYLARIYPRRANTQELGRLCFTYGKKTSRSTVASRISRINREAKRIIGVPIIDHIHEEGYGFKF